MTPPRVQAALLHRARGRQHRLDDVRPRARVHTLRSPQCESFHFTSAPASATPPPSRRTPGQQTPHGPCRNSEIYNHKELEAAHIAGVDMHTTSDSALLGYWFAKEGRITHEMLDSLDGIFATTVLDERTGHFVVARDPMGICPLYWGKGADGSTWFASEMKALHDVCETFEIFPPVRATAACPQGPARVRRLHALQISHPAAALHRRTRGLVSATARAAAP